MRAARLQADGQILIDTVPSPDRPGPDEAIVAPLLSGICGTDVKEFTGRGGSVSREPHPLTGAGIPLVLGHEFSARVVATGAEIDEVAAGDLVAVMPLQHCGRCAACLTGAYTRCVIKAWTGLSSPWGGFAERAVVKSYQLTPLSGISVAAGAVIEPAAVAVHAVRRANLAAGDTVLVAGAGAIGALCVLAARALGASRVFVFEPNEQRRALVAGLGAEAVCGDGDAVAADLRERTDGLGVDVAMDCAGVPASADLCVASVRPGGSIGIPAVHKGPTNLDIRRMTRDDLTMAGSVGYSRDSWERTVALVRSGALPIEKIVTDEVPLEQIVERGFKTLTTPGETLKILVRVND